MAPGGRRLTPAPHVDDFLLALARASIGDFSARVPVDEEDAEADVTQLALALNILLSDLDHKQRQLQAAHKDLEQKVEERTRELQAANDALRRTNESLEAFSYVVSHDLKEPVRGILAMTDALRDARDERDREEFLRHLDEAATRLARMVEGLLEFSRAVLHTHRPPEAVFIEDALADPACQGRFANVADLRHAHVEVVPGPAVLAVPPALHQMIGNLVLNAILHNPKEPPRVRVSARPTHDANVIEVRVEDDGPGFPPSVETVFTRARGDRPTTMRGGFGLTIARRAAEHMGGRMLLARSQDLGGAAIRVLLPAAK